MFISRLVDADTTLPPTPTPPATPTPTPLGQPTATPTALPKPVAVDGLIRNAGEFDYAGDNIYNTNGTSQFKRQTTLPGTPVVFHLKVQNDGTLPNRFTITGPASSSGWDIKYFDSVSGGTNITLQVTAGGWSTPVLASSESREYRVEVTPANNIPDCSVKDVLVRAAVFGDSQADVVKASVRATNSTPPAAPTGLYAISTGSGKITLYWESVPNATGYNVYRSTGAGNENYAAPIATGVGTPSYAGGSTLMWTDSGLTNGSEYFYTVKALNGCAEGEASNESSDIVDPEAIPWDSRDPGAILGAAAAFAQEAAPDEGFDLEEDFTIMGPDGAIYERGVTGQQPPSGTLDSDGRYTLRDGTPIALTSGEYPSDGTASSAPTGGITTFADIGRNVFTGAYRGARAHRGYRRCSFDVTLSSNVNLVGRSDERYARLDDTAYVYLGSSAPDVGCDFGLQYDGVRDNKWHMYGLVSSPTLKKPLVSSTTFDRGARVRMTYSVHLLTGQQQVTRNRMVFLTVRDTSGTGVGATIGALAYNHHNVNDIAMKRNQQIAQRTNSEERRQGYVKTGSYMLDFNWQNGRLWKTTEANARRWSLADTVIAKSYPEPSVDSVVSTTVLSKYDWETGVGIDLRPY